MEHITYNYFWFIFSILIGILFSYIAIDSRWKMIVFKDFKYNLWWIGCAISMGIGIWTMHFVGMFAMEMPTQIMYDSRIVMLSILISIIGTGMAFFIMKINHLRLLVSSVFMGGGIVGMHYIGISAMSVNFDIRYKPTIVILSIMIAVIAAYLSLRLIFFFNHNNSICVRCRILSSILLGIGMAGMHYIGMMGTHFSMKSDPVVMDSYYIVSSDTLSSFISIPAIIVVIMMLISGAYLDQKLISQIKESKESERKLRESEKLSLVGELAAGVAHEIRNPLTSLKGFTQMLYDNTNNQSNREYLKIMKDEINRINFIVSEFMVLSKPHLVHFSVTDLSIIIKNVITLLNTQAIIKNIVIIPVIVGDSFSLKCEENQIKQVLMNIIKNSIEAMQDGGNIYVKLEKKESNLVVSVIDNGVGIPEEKQHLLGKPFYTTKPEGTGLGLMVSKKIIQNHNGKLEIKSDADNGTIVLISLPIKGNHLEEFESNHQVNEELEQSS